MADRLNELKTWLKGQHNLVMGAEKEALESLANGDNKAYLAKMIAKAEILAALYKNAKMAGVLKDLPEPQADEVDMALQRFSSSATTALSLNSPFFMSALLYPDDHKPGEPDNLALLINSL